ncbi:MAG: menaquinone biosynthesis decarboxylase [Ardenticatenales bacterium]|nr:menaquinone biosynthesis decarboxylase [Ardenticatenales bacterium]
MAYDNGLHDFIKTLEAHGELMRIKEKVSPHLEITEITDRVSKEPTLNKALLFENVEGSAMPVLINAMGSKKRIELALNVGDINELATRVGELIKPQMPAGFMDKAKKGMQYLDVVRSVAPRTVKSAPCQEVVLTGKDASLDILPVLTCWPNDAGPFITLTTFITRDPESGIRNVGMYRAQVFDNRTLGVHWQRHKGGTEHQRSAQRLQKEKIPIALVLGGDPATIWSGSAPLPPNIDEFMLAGFLRGKGVDVVPCKSIPLEVPAEAEIVIEGWLDPNDQRMEGPFGDHTGYYSIADYYPSMSVSAITHRRKAIYPTTIVGKPPMEDVWMGKATERLFLPLMRLFLSEIVDVNMPAEGVFHNLVIVSIKKRYPGHARKVMYGIWGLGLMMLTKSIIIVDEDVDVQDLSQVAFEVLANYDPKRDVVIVEGATDDLDHAAPVKNYGGKMGIDGTRKVRGLDPEPLQNWPDQIVMSPEISALVDKKWQSYGFPKLKKS